MIAEIKKDLFIFREKYINDWLVGLRCPFSYHCEYCNILFPGLVDAFGHYSYRSLGVYLYKCPCNQFGDQAVKEIVEAFLNYTFN